MIWLVTLNFFVVIVLSTCYPKYQRLSNFMFHAIKDTQTLVRVTAWLHFPLANLKEYSAFMLTFALNFSLFISSIPIFKVNGCDLVSLFQGLFT